MRKLYTLVMFAICLAFATPAFASNAILDSLETKGVALQMMDDNALDEVRGTALTSGLPYPSTYSVIREHYYIWNTVGSKYDYRAYRNNGSRDYAPEPIYDPAGNILARWAGDIFLVDLVNGPNGWSDYSAQLMEYHLQLIHPQYPIPDGSGIQDYDTAGWNRPFGVVRW